MTAGEAGCGAGAAASAYNKGVATGIGWALVRHSHAATEKIECLTAKTVGEDIVKGDRGNIVIGWPPISNMVHLLGCAEG